MNGGPVCLPMSFRPKCQWAKLQRLAQCPWPRFQLALVPLWKAHRAEHPSDYQAPQRAAPLSLLLAQPHPRPPRWLQKRPLKRPLRFQWFYRQQKHPQEFQGAKAYKRKVGLTRMQHQPALQYRHRQQWQPPHQRWVQAQQQKMVPHRLPRRRSFQSLRHQRLQHPRGQALHAWTQAQQVCVAQVRVLCPPCKSPLHSLSRQPRQPPCQ